ncbi:MAG: tandem-95 repeat protein, partial [Bacteroidetes bacterium]|nr:tandem-95 repeat protein [Bacteroidota bacterium]
MIRFLPKKPSLSVTLVIAFLSTAFLFQAQTPGLIVQSATGASVGVLDPNGDGYVSTTTAGFGTNDLLNSEIAYKRLLPYSVEPNSDLSRGPTCGFTDFVEDSTKSQYPSLHFSNATHWLFRLRMASIAPNAKSYSIFIDTDGLMGPADVGTYSANNPGFEIEIVLATKFGVRIYNHDLPCGSSLVKSYGPDRIQKSVAASNVCSQTNFFLDFYVDWADLTSIFGINQSSPLRYAVVDNMAADKSTVCNPNSISDIAGVDDRLCGSFESCILEVINNQPPCPPNSATICTYSDCPTINNTPIQVGATSVSVTTTETTANTVLRIYVDNVQRGTLTVSAAGTYSITVSPALVAGQTVRATARATGEFESGTNCNNTKVVGQTCTPPITSASECAGSRAIQGHSPDAGATIRVYNAAGVLQAAQAGTQWNAGPNTVTSTSTPSILSPNTDNFLWKCGGSGSTTSCTTGGPCMSTGAYYITAQSPGKCESTPVWICIGNAGSSGVPTIATTITTSTTSVSGSVASPDNVAGTLVILYKNNAEIGRVNTTSGGSWTINGLFFSGCEVVKAIAVGSGKCASPFSASKTVEGGVTSTPTITGTYCAGPSGVTSVSGTSTEANGTIIQVFENGIIEGSTTTVNGGVWTASTGISIAAGSTITARATNSNACKTQSGPSPGVLVAGQNTNVVTITPSSLIETDLVINGTGVNGDLVTLYIDGIIMYRDFAETSVASVTVSGGNWGITLIDPVLYTGATITARSTNGSTCGSLAQDPTPVVCLPPSATLVVNPDNASVCTGTPLTNVQVVNSQANIIYQLFNNTLGAITGSSVMGTGGTITLSTFNLTANAVIGVRAIKSPFDGSCNNTLNETVNVTVINPPTIALGTSTNPTTCGGSEGTIRLTGLANNQSYTVNYTKNGVPTNGVFSSNGSGVIIITGLTAGTYTNFSTNGLGCASNNTIPGPVALSNPPTPTIAISSTNNPSVCGGNGTINLSFTNVANGSYTIVHNTGSFTGVNVSSNTASISVPVGNYSGLRITVAGCTSTQNPNAVISPLGSCPPLVTLSGTTSIAENAGSPVTITANLSVAAATATTITLTLTGTASNGVDYTVSSTTIVIPAGSLSGTITLTPTNDAVYEGNESAVIDITNVTGGNGAVESGTQQVTITIIDDDLTPPVANNDTTTVLEDNFASINVVANDTDVDGLIVASSVDLDPATPGKQTSFSNAQGSWLVDASGLVMFTPVLNFNGEASIFYTVDDNSGLKSNSAKIVINVTPVNDPPVVVNENITVVEDTPSSGSVTANDSDVDGSLFVNTTPVKPPLNGVFVVNSAGAYTYTPAANFFGKDTVVVQVCDNGTPLPSICRNDTIFVTVTPVNDAPIVNNDPVSTQEDTPVSGNILLNDSDVEGPLTATISPVKAPSNGLFVINAAGGFTYTPNSNFNGKDTVVISVCDNGTPIICINDSIFVTVTPVNDAPIIVNENITVVEDTPYTANITSNDTDVDGNLVVNTSPVRPPSNGVFVVDAAGVYTYTPATNFFGNDTVVVRICDDGTPLPAICINDTIFITVTSENDAPIVVNDPVSTPEDTPVSGNILLNDSDAEGPLTAVTTPVKAPINGTFFIDAAGNFTYTPNPNFFGSDTVVISVCDNGAPVICINDTIFVTVTPVNDAPFADDDSNTTNEDIPVLTTVVSNDSDFDGTINPASVDLDPSSSGIQSTFSNAFGTWTANSSGVVTYTPTLDFNGTATVTYRVNDNLGLSSNVATLTITVNAVNDAPVLDNEFITTSTNNSVGGDLTDVGDYDVDGNLVVNITPLIGPSNGSILISADGTFTYTPASGFTGNDMVVVQICDDGTPTPIICVNDTIFVQISATLPPVAVSDSVTILEDNQVSFFITTNDSDPDGSIDPSTVDLNIGVAGPQSTRTTIEGEWSVNASGELTFIPALNFCGTATLAYNVKDNTGATSNIASIKVKVTCVNDGPVLDNEFISVKEDSVFTGDLTDVGDFDVDGNLVVTTTPLRNPSHGTILITADGDYTYTPFANYFGPDTVIVEICDDGFPLPKICVNDTIFVTVTPVNDAPVANNDSNATNEDTPVLTDIV